MLWSVTDLIYRALAHHTAKVYRVPSCLHVVRSVTVAKRYIIRLCPCVKATC